MTAEHILTQCDALCPNAFTDEEKLRWLWQLDAQTLDECARYLDASFTLPADGYSKQSALLIDDEYGDVYLKYLLSQIDLANAEFGRYNASAALFNAAYARYCDHLTRMCAANVPQKGVIV